MIEITAKLYRGPVYFTSQQVKCFVTFKNVLTDEETRDSKERSRSVSNEMLAWSGVQIYCHCCLDDSRVHFLPDRMAVDTTCTSSDTSFNPCRNEKGHLIFSTQTKILFCMLSLAPNESKTFVYTENIPSHSPPSYYGTSVKYLYKLTIGTQRVKEGIHLLRIPLRILQIHSDIQKGLNLSLNDKMNRLNFDETGDVSPKIQVEQGTGADSPLTEEDVLNLVIDQLDSLTARKNTNSYVITNPSGQVGKFCLLKSSFKLGEDVIGIFNFSEASVPCVQFSVSLQSEELISEDCRMKAASRQLSGGPLVKTTHSRFHDFCLHTESSQVILPIPLTITPAFQTNIVSLTWKLHFEFVTTKADNLVQAILPDSQGYMAKSPAHLDVQTMFWDLPLLIHPNHPVTVARGLQLPACSTLIV